jgi:hypothetical protein
MQQNFYISEALPELPCINKTVKGSYLPRGFDFYRECYFTESKPVTFNNKTLTNELRTQLLNSNVYSDKSKVETAIDQAIKYWTERNFYTEHCNKRFSDEIKKTQEYTTLVQSPIDDNTKYVVDYTFTTEGTQDQKTRINNIYSTNNINTKTNTFDGKIKFN